MHSIQNPFFSIWYDPRGTIQYLLKTNPRHSIYVLAALAGLSNAIGRSTAMSVGDSVSTNMILVLIFLVGPVAGVFSLYILGWSFAYTGKWLGGQALKESLYLVIAWANIPVIAAILVYVMNFSFFGMDIFHAKLFLEQSHSGKLAFTSAFQLLLSIWSFLILCQGIGQVQGFSAWKGLANVLLGFFVVFVILLVMFSVFYQVARLF